MDDSKYFSYSTSVDVHGGQAIQVTYTNDPAEVQRVLDMYKQWIDSGDDKFMGLDMEYTCHKAKKMAVLQLAMRRHVLVFHYSWYEKHFRICFL